MSQTHFTQTLPRNNLISYVKGLALVAIILIHLIDWCEIKFSSSFLLIKEFLFPFVLLFVATSGLLVVMASQKYSLNQAAWRFFKRGLEILSLYFLYNLAKFYIFDFNRQPFFIGAIENNTLNALSILQLKAFSVPITILATIGIFVTCSPVLLWLLRKTSSKKSLLGGLILVISLANYFFVWPQSAVISFLYSDGYVLFPLALWVVPFLIGALLAHFDLNQNHAKWILGWLVLTLFFGFLGFSQNQHGFLPSQAMYPLKPYYISFSFLVLFLMLSLFKKIEPHRSVVVQSTLKILKLWGDNTLSLYLGHWLVIDITAWLAFEHLYLIWLNMPLFLMGYVYLNKNKLFKNKA